MSVTINVTDLKHARDLLTAYKSKDAFEFNELSDVSGVYQNLVDALKAAEEAASDTAEISVSKKDVAYMVQAMHVCSIRKPMEIQNYGIIFKLFTTLGELVKEASDEEESKEE